MSADTKIKEDVHAPLGEDPKQVYENMRSVIHGLQDYDKLSDKDKKSLGTTARKTYVIDVEGNAGRPPCRFINVHAKEFKTEEGTALLGKYFRALAGDLKGY